MPHRNILKFSLMMALFSANTSNSKTAEGPNSDPKCILLAPVFALERDAANPTAAAEQDTHPALSALPN
jgi:hypothetical protein